MPLNILSKFGDNRMIYDQVREQTTVKCQIVINSRAITQKCPMPLAEQQTWQIFYAFELFEQVC